MEHKQQTMIVRWMNELWNKRPTVLCVQMLKKNDILGAKSQATFNSKACFYFAPLKEKSGMFHDFFFMNCLYTYMWFKVMPSYRFVM